MVFVEDYDIYVGRRLTQGVDLWLNNPLRPLEASGTSGMKLPPNGGLNLSVLDGWWCEGYNGKNGWAIGAEIKDPLDPNARSRNSRTKSMRQACFIPWKPRSSRSITPSPMAGSRSPGCN